MYINHSSFLSTTILRLATHIRLVVEIGAGNCSNMSSLTFSKASQEAQVAQIPDARENTTLNFEWVVRGLKNLFDNR